MYLQISHALVKCSFKNLLNFQQLVYLSSPLFWCVSRFVGVVGCVLCGGEWWVGGGGGGGGGGKAFRAFDSEEGNGNLPSTFSDHPSLNLWYKPER